MTIHSERTSTRRLLAVLALLAMLAATACQAPKETGQLGVSPTSRTVAATTAGGAA